MTWRGLTAGAALVLGLAGCGDASPPEPGEGAAGFVSAENAGAAQNPQTPALAGGPAGQTPASDKVGGVPTIVYSDGTGPAAADAAEAAGGDAPENKDGGG
jgi:hypothetical protein